MKVNMHRNFKSVARWKREAERHQREAHVFYFAFKHPRAPWYAKLVGILTMLYLFSPVQLIPSFIPVIGFLDDLLILLIGAKLLVRFIPADVFAECRELAAVAEVRRKEKIRSTAGAVGFAAIAAVWLLAGFTASALMAAYIAHRR